MVGGSGCSCSRRGESRTKKPVEIGGRRLVRAGSSKPQPPKEEGTEELQEVLLKIHLHCDVCIDRIRRWIYRIKGVKGVMLDASKDQVKVTGTMDVATMVPYLTDKLNRAVAPVKDNKDRGKGNKMAGPSMASAAASMADAAPVQARTPDVASYSQVPYPPSYDASGYYHHPPSYDASGYYENTPAPPGTTSKSISTPRRTSRPTTSTRRRHGPPMNRTTIQTTRIFKLEAPIVYKCLVLKPCAVCYCRCLYRQNKS